RGGSRKGSEIGKGKYSFSPDIYQPGRWTRAACDRTCPGRVSSQIHIEHAAFVVHCERVPSYHRAGRGHLRRTLISYEHPVRRGETRHGRGVDGGTSIASRD